MSDSERRSYHAIVDTPTLPQKSIILFLTVLLAG